jgi:hypothetical protein
VPVKLSLVALALAVPFLASSLQAQSRPIPRGIREADQAEAQTDKNIPPPMSRGAAANPEKLKHDADELATLAESIPADVNQTTKGVLPKDLNDKLKRIEKLAKQLRNALSP